MAGETLITVVGNLTADPELRATQNGAQVAGFTVASTPRTFNRQTNEWDDGEALFMRCSVWRQMAEHVAGSLRKGNRVIVQGHLKQRSYQDREGNNRSSIELDVVEIGPSLAFATAQVTRAGQGGGQQQAQQGQQQGYGAPQGYGPPQGQPQGQPGFQPQTQGFPQQAVMPQQQMPQQPQQGFPQQQGGPVQQPPQGMPQPQPQQPMPSPQNPGWGNGQPQAFPGQETPF